jgi:hypothetical protein
MRQPLDDLIYELDLFLPLLIFEVIILELIQNENHSVEGDMVDVVEEGGSSL